MIVILVFMIWYYRWQAEDAPSYPAFSPAVKAAEEEPSKEELLQLEKDALIEKVDSLIENESVSEAIVSACMKHTDDYKLCIKNVIGVSNAESGMFGKGMSPTNDWFWWMYQWIHFFNNLTVGVNVSCFRWLSISI